jgi:hypothetical protein
MEVGIPHRFQNGSFYILVCIRFTLTTLLNTLLRIVLQLLTGIQDASTALEIATYLEPLHYELNRLDVGKIDVSGPIKDLFDV